MFSTTGLFKNVTCPEGEGCALLNCIFSHTLQVQVAAPRLDAIPTGHTDGSSKPAPRKRKRGEGLLPDKTPSAETPSRPSPKSIEMKLSNIAAARGEAKHDEPPRSLYRPISPPPRQVTSKAKPRSEELRVLAKSQAKEALNPRMIPNDPAGHAKRTLYLTHMHEHMKRLNAEVADSAHPRKEVLRISDDELVKTALDEEERIARDSPKVYGNMVKLRIAAYKKMKLQDWIAHVKVTFSPASGKPDEKGAQPESTLNTGLPMSQEHLLLPRMITDQVPLSKHGYVITPPTEADMAEANATVALAQNYEVCDRCKSRFQVFPDRRAQDGALTTNGPCVHHWGKMFTARREKTDAMTGPKEAVYTCCNELLNTPGCSEAPTHAYKINDPKRMAAVLPFIQTPANPDPAKCPDGKPPRAVTFDCEMGYTTYGLELIRLTAVSWPEGDELVDVLVRPQGAILDLNSRFSGVWPDAYHAAIPYHAEAPPPPPVGPAMVASGEGPPPSRVLTIVPSPVAARALLCTYLTPETPLIGHALENDLNSVRLCHARIIDTIVLFPHPRGLPLRFGLKMLTRKHLNRDIQMGGAMGHDSLEDARATGDLVRYMVGKRWTEMKRDGWKIEDDELLPPLPAGLPPPPEGTDRILGAATGDRRQRIQVDGDASAQVARKRSRMEM